MLKDELGMAASTKRQSWGSKSALDDRAIVRALDAVVDGGLIAVLLFAPWFMGGRHPLGELVYLACVVAAALAFLCRQALSGEPVRWIWSGAEWLIAAAVGLVLLQASPLPVTLFRLLSHHSGEVLTLWNGSTSASLGAWNRVSMAPAATWSGLTILLGHSLLLLVAIQRLRSTADVQRLLRLIAVATVTMATVGLLQYLAGNGKFMWVYEHPHRDTLGAVKGPFINKNHFAHMLALGVGSLIWSLQQAVRRQRGANGDEFASHRVNRPQHQLLVNLHLLGLAVVLFAGLMSLSRGGIAVLGLATVISLAASAKAGLLNVKLIAGIAGIALLTGGSLAIHGYQQVTQRLDDYTAGSVDEMDADGARRAIWTADLAAIRDYPVLGTGVGTHTFTYPMYLAKPWPTVFTHAESGYIHVALETGLLGLALALAGIVLVARWSWRGLRSTKSDQFACAVALTSGLVASVIHSIWDFVWYLPACMSLTVLLAAGLFRLAQQTSKGTTASQLTERPSRPALTWGAVATVALCSAWMVNDRFCAAMAAPHWDAYVKFTQQPEFKQGTLLPDQATIEHLEQVVHWTPDEPTPHLRLANECLRRFEREQSQSDNAIPLNQISDAAIASKFPTRAELNAWLDRAVGPARKFLDLALWHTREALRATPLQDDGYIFISDLHFLEAAGADAGGAYIEQALRVRPHSARVLMAAGKQAALSGDYQAGIDYWRRSLSTDIYEQRQLVDLLIAFSFAAQSQTRQAGQPDTSAVQFILNEFQPELPMLRLLLQKLEHVASQEELDLIRAQYVRVSEAMASQTTENDAVPLWLEMSNIYHDLRQDQKAVAILRRVVAVRPNEYAAVFSLGLRLIDVQQYAEARRHLEWCRLRRPDDTYVNQLLAQAIKGQVDGQAGREARQSSALR
jgi:O-antigen ligase/tetratricopeptide (TPR) repeat protein